MLVPVLLGIAVLAGLGIWWATRSPEPTLGVVAEGPILTADAGTQSPPLPVNDVQVPVPVVSFDAAVRDPDAQTPILIDAGSPMPDAKVKTSSRPRPRPRPKDDKDKGKGTLRITSNPWAQVYVDGKHVGHTPFRKVLSAGTHRIRLHNESTGTTKTRKVLLKKGETSRIHEKW